MRGNDGLQIRFVIEVSQTSQFLGLQSNAESPMISGIYQFVLALTLACSKAQSMREPHSAQAARTCEASCPPDASGYCFLRTTSGQRSPALPVERRLEAVSPSMCRLASRTGVLGPLFRQIEDRKPACSQNPLNPFPQVPFLRPPARRVPRQRRSQEVPPTGDRRERAGRSSRIDPGRDQAVAQAELHAELERQPAMRDTRRVPSAACAGATGAEPRPPEVWAPRRRGRRAVPTEPRLPHGAQQAMETVLAWPNARPRTRRR